MSLHEPKLPTGAIFVSVPVGRRRAPSEPAQKKLHLSPSGDASRSNICWSTPVLELA